MCVRACMRLTCTILFPCHCHVMKHIKEAASRPERLSAVGPPSSGEGNSVGVTKLASQGSPLPSFGLPSQQQSTHMSAKSMLRQGLKQFSRVGRTTSILSSPKAPSAAVPSSTFRSHVELLPVEETPRSPEPPSPKSVPRVKSEPNLQKISVAEPTSSVDRSTSPELPPKRSAPNSPPTKKHPGLGIPMRFQKGPPILGQPGGAPSKGKAMTGLTETR